MKKRIIALIMASVMTFSSGFTVFAEESFADNSLVEVGETLYGFTAVSQSEYKTANAEVMTFEHTKSGATLVYIKNDDKNLAFNISYRTPHTDESDRNHVFEHAILASSEKYPSTDIFFDLANKTYSTYTNAMTSNTLTTYPVSSMSEEQLKKMMDVYLSCMVSPEIMENENFFKREAINYTLEDKDSPIELGGTVFSEDTGYLTSMSDRNTDAVLDCLYPGEIASNSAGKAVENYKLLTYEHTKELYEMCYNFDNSIIVLYGDLDYKDFMKFIDEEYLSKYEKKGTDLSAYIDGKTPAKFTDEIVYAPAYEGDTVENSSVVNYAIDLTGIDYKDLFKLMYICTILNNDNSVIDKNLKEAGIIGSFSCDADFYSAKPLICFSLSNVNADIKDKFMSVIKASIKEISENGLGKSYENVLKSLEINDALETESIEFSVNSAVNLACYWVASGKTDFFELSNKAFEELKADGSQQNAKELFKTLLEPENSALVAVVPKPGLAEEIEDERMQYLEDLKASMSDEEINKMIEDTKAYNEWNSKPIHNNNVSIKPNQLPEPEDYAEVNVKTLGAVESYSSQINNEVGRYSILFDASSVKQEDLYFLDLYVKLFSKLNTDKYTSEDLSEIMPVYLNNFNISANYYDTKGMNSPHPVVNIVWYCLNEDYENSLSLLLNIMEKSDFGDSENIIKYLEETLPALDPAKSDDPMAMARNKALIGMNDNAKFNSIFNSKEYYKFLTQVLDKMKSDDDYCKRFNEKMNSITNQIVHKDNIITTVVSTAEGIEAAEKANDKLLNELNSINLPKASFTFNDAAKNSASIIEAANQYSVFVNEITDDFKGEYIPYVYLINDIYSVPQIRFTNGAYSGGTYFITSMYENYMYSYSYSDPNVGKTINTYMGLANSLKTANVTQDNLDNYIVCAYSRLVVPRGQYTNAATSITYEIMKADKTLNKVFADGVRNSKAEDKAAAINCIQEMIDNGYIAFVGNSNAINAEKDLFDVTEDFRDK